MRFSPTRMFVAEAGCLYLFRRDVQPPPEKENAKMRRGKAIHQAIEKALITDEAPRLPEAMHAYQWVRERWPSVYVERAIGIDPKTGAALGYNDREAIPSNHVAVVVDVHAVDGSAVYDHKTGSQFSKFDYGPQVRLNGYAVAALHRRDEIETGLAYLSADGVITKTWSLDEFDLANQRQKLRVWAEQAPTAEPTPCSACRYCPARTICKPGQEYNAKGGRG